MGFFSTPSKYNQFEDLSRGELMDEILALRERAQDTARATTISIEDTNRRHHTELSTLKADNKANTEELKNTHKLELSQKEFEMKHLADERVKKAEDAKIEMEKKLAVAESENKQLREIADLNGDIIDIKELVTKLIDKLPEIKLSSLGGNQNTTVTSK